MERVRERVRRGGGGGRGRGRGRQEGAQRGPNLTNEIRATLVDHVQNWFQQHPHFTVLYLPPYSPFLNPIEEFFSAWRWKVYDLRLQAEVPLIQAMEEACDQMEVAAMQGWIRHSRRFFPRCLANDNIACDVDEILWPDPARRRDNV